MVNTFMKHAIEDGQVGDVAGGTSVRMLGAHRLVAADEGFAHLIGLIRREYGFEHGKSVHLDFLYGLFPFVHNVSPQIVVLTIMRRARMVTTPLKILRNKDSDNRPRNRVPT